MANDKRLVMQDDVDESTLCPKYPCGLQVPKTLTCPQVVCPALRPPCEYIPNSAIHPVSGCPIYPCGTVDCDCPRPKCLPKPPRAVVTNCTLEQVDDVDAFGCPKFPCGVLRCDSSGEVGCSTINCGTSTLPRCTALERVALDDKDCPMFMCCDRTCPLQCNTTLSACSRFDFDSIDAFGCKLNPCCLPLAPCRVAQCRDPAIFCSDADRLETYGQGCTLRPCCQQCPQPACNGLRKCTAAERAATTEQGCPANHCCEQVRCDQRYGTCSQTIVCSPDKVARVDADGCRMEPCCEPEPPRACLVRQRCVPRVGCSLKSLEAETECKTGVSECVHHCDTPMQCPDPTPCVSPEPFCVCGCGLFRCNWRTTFFFLLTPDAPFSERALFRKLAALASPFSELQVSFEFLPTVYVNVSQSIEFPYERPQSFAMFREQHLALFSAIEGTVDWQEIPITLPTAAPTQPSASSASSTVDTLRLSNLSAISIVVAAMVTFWISQ